MTEALLRVHQLLRITGYVVDDVGCEVVDTSSTTLHEVLLWKSPRCRDVAFSLVPPFSIFSRLCIVAITMVSPSDICLILVLLNYLFHHKR